MLESTFQQKVLKYLRTRGGYWIKVHVGAYQLEGEPDIIGSYRGRFCAFELKQGSNKPTPLQLYKVGMINESGGLAMVAYDIDTIERALDLLDAELNELQPI